MEYYMTNNINDELACSFFGHRNAMLSEDMKDKLKELIENLILKHNVTNFLFGSRSNFNNTCHTIVTDLKKNTRK